MKDQAMRKEKSWLYAIFVDCSFRCLLKVLFAAASSKAHIKVEITVMERGSGNEAMDKILWSILNGLEGIICSARSYWLQLARWRRNGFLRDCNSLVIAASWIEEFT